MVCARTRQVAVIVIACSMLGACSSDSFSEVKDYVAKVKKRPAKPIEPLPEIKEAVVLTYSAHNQANPFLPPVIKKEETKGDGFGIQPDMAREKEPLESYPLDSLQMVGTIAMDDKRWGIILTQDGIVHRVKVGNYMGVNYGKVISVGKAEIGINEIVPDGGGGWKVRQSSVLLRE